MSLNSLGIPAAGLGVLMPKQSYRWQVIFSGLSALVPSASGRDLTRQATVIQRPNLSFAEIPIHRYNTTAYVAGKYEWDPFTFTVEDDITGLASAAVQGQITTQQQLIGADVGAYLPSAATGSDYKFGTTLQMLDGNEGVVETWQLEGCFISKVNWGNMDYNSSDAVMIELTIRFDQASQQLTGQGYGTALGGSLGAT
jgi:hypothetical protein